MSDKADRPKATSSASALVLCLMALAIVSVFLGLLAGAVVLFTEALGGRITPLTLVWAVVAFAAGCSVGAVLWALGWLCRNNHQRWQTERRMAIALEALTAPGLGGEGELSGALPVAPPPAKVYRPISKHLAPYDTLYAEYRRLYDYFGRGENNMMKVLRSLRRG